MISILIPIYNTSVVELVTALQFQALELQHPFEIICLDDCSTRIFQDINRSLVHLKGVTYVELAENIGRSRIRNQLADMASQPFLLFMDGDSKVVKADYLRNYVQSMEPSMVIYGGRVYQDAPPVAATYRLHWYYGQQREALPAKKRKLHPYRTFMTNNFLVPRAITLDVRFDENIRRYGYEDTLYALELQKKGYKILHIDNPLEHIGLEERPVFLRKVEEALENLKELLPEHPEIDTRLLQLVRNFQGKGLLSLLRLSSYLWLPIVKWIILAVPSVPLKILDLYKLGYFLR